MKHITLPLVSGTSITLFIGSGHLAVVPAAASPRVCYVLDGLHNDGGWQVALPASAVVKMIKEA